MIGIEVLKEEMLKAGCNKAQCESKVVPIVVGILADDPALMEKLKDLSAIERRMRELKDWEEREYRNIEFERGRLHRAIEDFNEERKEFEKEMETAETAEYRDRFKAVKMFDKYAEIDTKYDNTAFIIGLGSILSGNGMNPAEEIRKLNPRMKEIL